MVVRGVLLSKGQVIIPVNVHVLNIHHMHRVNLLNHDEFVLGSHVFVQPRIHVFVVFRRTRSPTKITIGLQQSNDQKMTQAVSFSIDGECFDAPMRF